MAIKETAKLKLSIDLRIVCAVLVVVMGVMLFLWKPWQTSQVSGRKITITGQSTVKSTPDEYQFSPSYQLTGTDQQTLMTQLTAKTNEVIAQLKKIGVKDSQIRLDTSSYNSYWQPNSDNTLTASITVTVNDKDMAQKIQDYLSGTNAYGSVTPYPTFSEKKRKTLEAQARSEAIADAKKKGQQSASQLDAKLGQVIEVKDSSNGVVMPYMTTNAIAGDSLTVKSGVAESLPLLSGEQQISVSVEVTYSIH